MKRRYLMRNEMLTTAVIEDSLSFILEIIKYSSLIVYNECITGKKMILSSGRGIHNYESFFFLALFEYVNIIVKENFLNDFNGVNLIELTRGELLNEQIEEKWTNSIDARRQAKKNMWCDVRSILYVLSRSVFHSSSLIKWNVHDYSDVTCTFFSFDRLLLLINLYKRLIFDSFLYIVRSWLFCIFPFSRSFF